MNISTNILGRKTHKDSIQSSKRTGNDLCLLAGCLSLQGWERKSNVIQDVSLLSEQSCAMD